MRHTGREFNKMLLVSNMSLKKGPRAKACKTNIHRYMCRNESLERTVTLSYDSHTGGYNFFYCACMCMSRVCSLNAGADPGAYICEYGEGGRVQPTQMSSFVLSCTPSAFFIILQTTM